MRKLQFAALLWLTAGVTLFAAASAADIQLPSETAQLKPSELPGFAVAAQKCALCHSADYISFQPPGMTKAQWTAEMTKMQHTYGAPISDVEVKLLGIYLAATWRCEHCHGGRQGPVPGADNPVIRSKLDRSEC